MTVPVALIATAGSLAFVAAIVFAMRKGKASEDDEDVRENDSVRDSVRSETSVVAPVSATQPDYSGDTKYQFPSSSAQRSSSETDIATIGGKRKSKRKPKRKSKRKYSKRV